MAKFLTFLLLIISLRSSYAQSCYCTTNWVYNQTYGYSCTANADCWACQPGAYSTIWQQAYCPQYQTPVCQTETQTVQESCPQGYTGQIIKTRTKTCPQGIWTETTQNTCVKSLTNLTNVTSPVSPVSPLNPNFNTSVTQTPSVPATATTPQSVQNSSPTVEVQTPQTTQPAPVNQNSANTSKGSVQALVIPKGKTYTPVGLALSLEVFQARTISQYNLFPTVNISQELPFHVKIHDQILMELLAVPLPTQDGLLKGMQNVIGIENE